VATLSALNTNGLNFSGLATGIDTSTIIAGLTKINQQRIDALKSQESGIATKQSAFVALQGKVFDLQSKAAALARSAGGSFDGRTATSSDPTALTATAGTAALPGTYTLTVSSLAQASQIASAGFSDPNAQIKQGTLALQVGSGAVTTVTVDSRNNTLQGLADSINSAGGDVRASIINDGSATPYRLLLTSTKTGAANTITATANLTTGTGADFDPNAATIQEATDAVVKLGTAASAPTVTSATNQLNSLIPGVSINLLGADPGKPVTLSVAPDTAGATQAIQDFVTSYNAVVDYVNSQSSYDAKSQTGGPLLGNRDAGDLLNDIAAAVSTVVPGANSAANRMSSVGLSFDNDGKLVLDQAKLGQALSGATGATMADIKKLFGLTGGVSDNPGVSFVLGSDKTKPSGATPYGVTVTAPATQAVVTASGPPYLVWPADATLQMKLNGVAGSVTIPAGNYTQDELLAMIQQQINGTAAFAGNAVSVGLDAGGDLQITSQKYGSGSKVEITGGDAAAGLGFTGTETAAGTDVAVYVTANVQTEAATGSGQSLIGNSGNANTDGLQVRSTLSAPGAASLSVTQGLASRLNQVLNKYLDTGNGRFKTINDGYQSSIDDIESTISKQNDVLAEKTDQLTQQFAAMETAVNNLKGLQAQLSSFAIPTASK
jgi:flagellar hook-associated protein 2